MLKPIDTHRLEKLKADLRRLNLRFPIAVLAVRMKTNRGNLSAYLNGRKPLSDQFLQRFYDIFKEDLEKAAPEAPSPSEELESNEEKPEAEFFHESAASPFPRTGERGILESIQYQLNMIIHQLNELDTRQQSIEALLMAGVNNTGGNPLRTSDE